MSEVTEHDLDLQEQIVRIKRAQIESDKFQAEQRKLMAEAAKFERERSLAPLVIATSLITGIAAGLVGLLGRLIP